MATGGQFPSDKERTNYARLCRAIVDLCSEVLRDVLSHHITPEQLHLKANTCRSFGLNPFQQSKLNSVHSHGYAEFDISLLYKLITNLCPTIQPTNGWTHASPPAPNEITVGDDIERIRIIRNSVYGHIPYSRILDKDFSQCWQELECVMMRMDSRMNKQYSVRLSCIGTSCMDSTAERTYLQHVEEMYNRDNDVIKEIQMIDKKLHQLSDIITDLKRDATTRGKSLSLNMLKRKNDNIYTCPQTLEKYSKCSHDMNKVLQERTLALIDQHRKDKTFVITKAVNEGIESLTEHGMLVYSGEPGSGKTTNALEIMSHLKDSHPDWSYLKLDDVRKWSDVVDTDIDSVVLLDDCLGKTNTDTGLVDDGNNYWPNIYACVETGKVKVIMTVRKNILAKNLTKLEKYRIFDKVHTIDMTDQEYQLTINEKHDIFKHHCAVNSISVFTERRDENNKSDSKTIRECKLGFAAEYERIFHLYGHIATKNMDAVQMDVDSLSRSPEIQTSDQKVYHRDEIEFCSNKIIKPQDRFYSDLICTRILEKVYEVKERLRLLMKQGGVKCASEEVNTLNMAFISVVKSDRSDFQNTMSACKLLQLGADINTKDENGNTALDLAIQREKIFLVRLLLSPDHINTLNFDIHHSVSSSVFHHDNRCRDFVWNCNSKCDPALIAKTVVNYACSEFYKQCAESRKHLEVWAGYKTENREHDLQGLSLVAQSNSVMDDDNSEVFHQIPVIWRTFDIVSTEGSYLASFTEKYLKDKSSGNKHLLPTLTGATANSLFKRHTNLNVVSTSFFKSKGYENEDQVMEEPCITLYCSVKGIIPLEESPFPRSIEGYTTDVREGFCKLGHGQGPRNLLSALKMGCCISSAESKKAGTLGGFVENNGKTCFITCSHVLYNSDELQKKQFSSGRGVYQPGLITTHCSNIQNQIVGEVIDARFDTDNPNKTSVDVALVKVNRRFPVDDSFPEESLAKTQMAGFQLGNVPKFETGRILTDVCSGNLTADVIKFGGESGLTAGCLVMNPVHVKLYTSRPSKMSLSKNVRMYQQYEVFAKTDYPFFRSGDSGSLIFTQHENDLHCIGMAIGATSYGSCIMTPISEVLKSLKISEKFKTFESSAAFAAFPSGHVQMNNDPTLGPFVVLGQEEDSDMESDTSSSSGIVSDSSDLLVDLHSVKSLVEGTVKKHIKQMKEDIKRELKEELQKQF